MNWMTKLKIFIPSWPVLNKLTLVARLRHLKGFVSDGNTLPDLLTIIIIIANSIRKCVINSNFCSPWPAIMYTRRALPRRMRVKDTVTDKSLTTQQPTGESVKYWFIFNITWLTYCIATECILCFLTCLTFLFLARLLMDGWACHSSE